MMNVFAPSIGRKPEILRQQIRQLRRRFSRENPLYDVLMAGISFWLPQENPPAGLGAEYVLAPIFGENICSILWRLASAQWQLTQIAKGWHDTAMHTYTISGSV